MPAQGEQALLSFRIGGRQFALNADRVSEVVRQPIVTRVPHAPSSLRGVASLRGKVLPVVSLGALLGVADTVNAGAGRLIVLDDAEPIALAVDEVLGFGTGDGAAGLVEMDDGAARVVQLDQLLLQAFSQTERRTAARRASGYSSGRTPTAAEATAEFLAFTLAAQPYALPLSQVREVIPAPPDVVALPRTDAAMIGIALSRGALTPIVSTRALLGLPAAAMTVTDRVIVTTVAGARIGLAADRVDAVVRAPVSALGPVPRVLNRGAGEARVAAMLRTRHGGLISVLEPERLFAEESLAQILEDGRRAQSAADVQDGAAAKASHRFLVFQLADETYGMDIAAVEEVVMLTEQLARAPRAPSYLAGIMSVRGLAVPVIDQRRRFGLQPAAPNGRQRVIISRIDDMVAGFAVDAVTQILELPSERLAPTPDLTQDAARLFDRVAQIEEGGRVILLVNPRELLDRAERDLLAALAAEAPPA
jgi:purine-binding chemotaxis protein CheW